MNFADRLAKLNPQQLQAVKTIEGPVLVVAGPGTGKTEMLAMRIANILQQTDASPHNILCITFTEAGVTAMRRRLISIIGQDAYYVTITTFHGFCNEVIQQNPQAFTQFNSKPTQLDDLSRIKLVQSILDSLDPADDWHLRPFHDKYSMQYEIISNIQTLKQEGVSPEQLLNFSEKTLTEYKADPVLNKKTGEPTIDWSKQLKVLERNVDLAQIYQMYQQKLAERNFYDYDDMIMFVIEAFERNFDLLSDYWERYQYTLVDEYQDTNGSQNKLIKLLGSYDDSPNLFAVGDDDQAIYRFQGANVDNLLFFEQQFSNVTNLGVGINYRSNQAILDAAQDLIQHNQNRLTNIIPTLDKKLTAGLPLAKHKPEVYRFSTGDAENRFLTQKIQELVTAGASYQDFAVIYRRHQDAEDVIESLIQAGIPIKLASGANLLNDPAVLKLIKLLKLARFDISDRESVLFEVLFYDFVLAKFGITRLEVFQLLRFVNDYNYANRELKDLELFDVISDPRLLEQAVDGKGEGLTKLAAQIVDWKAASYNDTLSQFVAKLMYESGFSSLVNKIEEQDIDTLNAVNSFYSYIRDLTRANKQITLDEFLLDLQLFSEYNLSIAERKLDLDLDGVQLLTAHAAKGLEFKYVFIIKVVNKNWGGKVSRRQIKLPGELLSLVKKQGDSEKDLELEDERRLLFVAMTRAQQQLFISSADSYVNGAEVQAKEPSQFIAEIDPQLLTFPSSESYEDISMAEIKQGLSLPAVTDFSIKEQAYLRSLVENFVLSASALNEYLECPLKFLFNRLLKVPIPTNKHLALGNATHYALEKLSRSLIAGEQPDKSEMIANFRFALDKETLGGEEYIEAKAEGERILNQYFDFYDSNFVTPAAVEHHVSKVPLQLPDGTSVLLTGKIDKVEWVDQENGVVKIVDYKTSSPKSEGEIRGTTKNSEGNIFRQLVFYQLLAELDPNFRPPGKMYKYKVNSMLVDFLKSDNGKFKQVEITVTPEDVENLKQEIFTVVGRIRNLEFGADDGCVDWDLIESLG